MYQLITQEKNKFEMAKHSNVTLKIIKVNKLVAVIFLSFPIKLDCSIFYYLIWTIMKNETLSDLLLLK